MATEYVHDDDDALSPEAIETEGQDIRGTVFIIPLDAPVPNELQDVNMPKGTLYERLKPLATDTKEEFSFCPLTGSEIMALDRAWRMLQAAKKVAILTDLPGARYDIIFTQAMKQIGLRSIDWPVVAEAIARRIRTVQRTNDTTPWILNKNRDVEGATGAPEGAKRRKMGGSNIADADRALPLPPETPDEVA